MRNGQPEQVGVLQSVQVGTPKHYDTVDAWETSFFREPSTQPRWLYTTHLEGNQQADTKNHGQLHQAVLLYAAAQALAACPLLHEFWQELVVRRATRKNL